MAARRSACAARLAVRLEALESTLPPEILVPGQRPSQEAKCLALLKRDKSGPTSAMTFRAVVVDEEGAHQYLIDNRDKIFAKHLDDSIRALGIEVLRSPVASPKTNSICERVIGTIRRECLDWVIPLSEAHLRSIVRSWVEHYNCGRPHSMLGPGVPDPPRGAAVVQKSKSRHRLAAGALVLAKSVLGGLHHEYSIATASA